MIQSWLVYCEQCRTVSVLEKYHEVRMDDEGEVPPRVMDGDNEPISCRVRVGQSDNLCSGVLLGLMPINVP